MGDLAINDDWYREGFRELYPVVYAHRTVEAAEPEAGFTAIHLRLGPRDHLLDLGCGNGRHLVHLAKIAGEVAGVDYSTDLLRLARANVGEGARLVRADMRRVPFPAGAFDAVVNFFTTFGYFATDDENALVAGEIARVLKPGGRWLIDCMNPAHVRATLAPETERESSGYAIRERRWIDGARRRVNKQVEVARRGTVVGSWGESVRMYEEAELRDLLARSGLAVTRVFGNYSGDPAADNRPRLICVGVK